MQHTHPRHGYGYEYEMISTRFVKLYGLDVEIYIYIEREREKEHEKNDTHVMYTHAYKNAHLIFSSVLRRLMSIYFFFSFLRHLFLLTDYYLHDYEYMSFVNISLFFFAVFCARCLSAYNQWAIKWNDIY